jgi:UDP-glucuronate 4-epimerase
LPPHRLYNLGSNKSEKLTDFIAILERAIGRPALITFEVMQLGDVPKTCADIEESRRDLGFEPHISIVDGLPIFVKWYQEYYNIAK